MDITPQYAPSIDMLHMLSLESDSTWKLTENGPKAVSFNISKESMGNFPRKSDRTRRCGQQGDVVDRAAAAAARLGRLWATW